MAKPELGRIVRVEILDPQGKNPKLRPLVVVDVTGTPLIGVAISSQLEQSDPKMRVELPFQPQGRCITKLKKRCAAICDWPPVRFDEEDIIEYLGVVPTDRFIEIQKRLIAGSSMPDPAET